jgi:hypothetical protein
MDGEERTTKYAEGAKREATLLLKDESYRQCNYSGRLTERKDLRDRCCPSVFSLNT